MERFSRQKEREAQVFCGGDRTQSCYTACGSWRTLTQHGIERGAGSIPPFGRLSEFFGLAVPS